MHLTANLLEMIRAEIVFKLLYIKTFKKKNVVFFVIG